MGNHDEDALRVGVVRQGFGLGIPGRRSYRSQPNPGSAVFLAPGARSAVILRRHGTAVTGHGHGPGRAVLLRDTRNTALITGSISGTGLAIALRLARSGGAVDA